MKIAVRSLLAATLANASLISPLVAAGAADEGAPGYRFVMAGDGGFLIEHPAIADGLEPVGLVAAHHATLADLSRLTAPDGGCAMDIDFADGVKLEGVYSIKIGREDGTVVEFQDARDVIAFAMPMTDSKFGRVTTLRGGVVFALKPDNERSVQRFERGVITLTRTRKEGA